MAYIFLDYTVAIRAIIWIWRNFLYNHEIFMLLYKCIKMYRTASQFFGFYQKFIQGKKSHKNQTEKFKTKLRKIRQNPRKTLDIFALCSNKIQSQNYTFVIPLFLLIQKLYEKSAVSHAHRGLKKYTTFNYLSLLIRVSVWGGYFLCKCSFLRAA